MEERCNFLGDNPVYTGDLPSPPGPPGQPWDANRDNKLDCWKWAVKGYDSNGTCCQQYGATDSGCNPPCGRGHVHRGQDLGAPCGSLVRSPGKGVVVEKGWQDGLGNYVKVRLDDGKYVILGHLSGFADWVAVNRRSYPGQAIGFVGNTGCGSCGCHLHLQVQLNQYFQGTGLGNTLDPKAYFSNC